jgi:hypothetical protein
MSLAEIKAEVDRMTPKEQDELRLYLRSKIRPMDAETRRRLTEKIDDNDPSHWLTLEEFGKRVGVEE